MNELTDALKVSSDRPHGLDMARLEKIIKWLVQDRQTREKEHAAEIRDLTMAKTGD